jgi:hypothetical protein
MADNSSIPVAVGNETFANNDVSGVKYPRIKATWGPAGSAPNDTDVASGKPFPIQLRGSDGTDRSNLLPVSISTLPAGTNNIGDIDVLTVPADPFGVNADAASVSTSISAKLKAIATALGITALDRGAGVAGSGTLRVVLPDSQIETGKYKAFPNTVSTTTTMTGAGSGATGDFLSTVTIVPETLNPGSISIKDGSATAIVIFAGGTGSVLSLVPFTVNLGYTSASGAWQIVTGSGGNVHGVCGGNFT